MPTSTEAILYTLCFALILPLAIYSLLSGSKPPEGGPLAKYYRIEPYLPLAGNLFLLVLCVHVAGKLALYYGLIDASTAETIDTWTLAPFFIMLLVFIALFVRAVLKVRRASQSG